MAHPQNSPRGLFAKNRIDVGTQNITDDGTNLVLSGSIKIDNAAGGVINANSSGIILPTVSALPATRVVGGVAFFSNSTGRSLVFHSTGTTWLYASGTSVAPS
jgi:hypothetical protein